MGRIYTGIAAWNLLFLLAACVLGFGRNSIAPAEAHILVGLFSAIFCCLVHAIVFAHFIGSGKWIKRGVEAAGMDAAIVKRTKRFKAKTFPFALFSMLFAVAAAVLGGGALKGVVAPSVHLVLALVTVALNVIATLFERSAIIENTSLIERVAEANRARVEAGIPEAARPGAEREAMRAGSKVMLFLAANVWLLYAYRRFVVRRPEEPLWPYLVGCALLVLAAYALREPAPSSAGDRA